MQSHFKSKIMSFPAMMSLLVSLLICPVLNKKEKSNNLKNILLMKFFKQIRLNIVNKHVPSLKWLI